MKNGKCSLMLVIQIHYKTIRYVLIIMDIQPVLCGKHKLMITNSVHGTVDRGKQYDSSMEKMNITTEVTHDIK